MSIRPRQTDGDEETAPAPKKMKLNSSNEELIHILNENVVSYLSEERDILSYVLCCRQSSQCLSIEDNWNHITRNVVFTGGFHFLTNHKFNNEQFQQLFQFVIKMKEELYPRIEAIEKEAENAVFEDYKQESHSIEGEEEDDYLFQAWDVTYMDKNKWYKQNTPDENHITEESSEFLFTLLSQFLKQDFVDRIQKIMLKNTRVIFKETKQYDFAGYTMFRGSCSIAQLTLNEQQEWNILDFKWQIDSYVTSLGVYIDNVMLSECETGADKYYGPQPENYNKVFAKLAQIFGVSKQIVLDDKKLDKELFEPYFENKIVKAVDAEVLSTFIENLIVTLYIYIMSAAVTDSDPDEYSLDSTIFNGLMSDINTINESLSDEDKLNLDD
jgi:hypothetical protein